jgi:hypothetical protein
VLFSAGKMFVLLYRSNCGFAIKLIAAGVCFSWRFCSKALTITSLRFFDESEISSWEKDRREIKRQILGRLEFYSWHWFAD